VKHYFQYLFTAAVLLVALMIHNGQKDEYADYISGNPVTQHVELLAELSPNQLPGYISPSYNQGPVLVNESIWRHHKALEYLNSADYQTQLKTQMQIHLGFKPVLDFQSGQNLYLPSRFADPHSV
jgi:hypothetical protein